MFSNADDSFIHGSSGCSCAKGDCERLLDALEFIPEHDFKPKRTILTGFRFDEEMWLSELRNLVNGSEPQGALHLADLLLDRYGKGSSKFVIDEGGSEIRNMYGITFTLPGTVQKVPPPKAFF